jgi:hypothetical protein
LAEHIDDGFPFGNGCWRVLNVPDWRACASSAENENRYHAPKQSLVKKHANSLFEEFVSGHIHCRTILANCA